MSWLTPDDRFCRAMGRRGEAECVENAAECVEKARGALSDSRSHDHGRSDDGGPIAMSQFATSASASASAPASDADEAVSGRQSRWESLKPLVLDAVVPTASYYLLSKGFGMSTLAALAWSSVVPAGRTLWGLVKERRLNGFAALILVASLVGLLLSLLAGDPRLMLAKDSGITATIGIAVLVSVAVGRPLMTVGLKPWVTKGNPVRTAVWERLVAERGQFARMERMFSVMWGAALFGEAVVRVVGAYTLPVDTMVWLGGVVAGVTITATVVISGHLVVEPMEKKVTEEVDALGRSRAVRHLAGEAGELGA